MNYPLPPFLIRDLFHPPTVVIVIHTHTHTRAPDAEYKLYTDKLQAEYGYLDVSEFKSMRLRLLSRLLKIPSIFTTPAVHNLLEKAARENVLAEIDELKKN